MSAQVRRHGAAYACGQQPLTEQQHDEHGAGHEGDASQGELGETEGADPGLVGGLGDDDVDRASGEQQHPTRAAGERQRHQQTRGRRAPDRDDHRIGSSAATVPFSPISAVSRR